MLEGELDKIHDFQKAKVCVISTPLIPLAQKSPVLRLDNRAIEPHQNC